MNDTTRKRSLWARRKSGTEEAISIEIGEQSDWELEQHQLFIAGAHAWDAS